MPAISNPRQRRTALTGVAAVALALSFTGTAQAQRAGTAITPAEAQQGAQAHPQFLQEFGGAMQGPQASYVEQVGKNIAVQSGLANSQAAFNVTLLNSSVNNAFAIPGGYVYVTRQLVDLMNNEAELAGVLGHEIGHVAARHSQSRQQTAQRNGILGVLGQVVGGLLGGTVGNLLSQGAQATSQLLTAKYSRGQEVEADNLGVRYLRGAGYDPRAMATVLQSLAAQTALEAQLEGRNATVPAWASTHPDPASRVRGALQQAGNAAGGVTNRDTFLTRIDGLLYGDDPRQGVVEGNTFIHPDMRLTFSVPNGYYIVNGTRAVSVNGQGGQAQLTTAAYNGNLESYVRQAFQAVGGQQTQLAPQNLQPTTINGIPAMIGTARVNSNQGTVDVTIVAYEFSRNQAFHFAAITAANGARVFNPMFGSLRRISAAESGQVVPRVIDVVTAGRNDSIQTLAGRMAYSNGQVERFRVLNGLAGNAQVVPGQKYKIVVRGG